MRIGLAIDVSTDVSHEFIVENGVHVLPSTIHMGDSSHVYGREPERSLAFYQEYLDERTLDAETSSFSVREIEELFLRKLVVDYDYVFLITVSSTRSQTYENAHKAAFAILQSYAPIRREHRVEGPFAIRVVDSQNLCAGPGVLAWEAARLVRHGHTPQDIRLQLDDLLPYVHAYLVPQDLYYIRTRAARRGDHSVNLFSYILGQTLDIKPILQAVRGETRAVAKVRHYEAAAERLFQHAVGRVEAGLLVPLVNISYGGDPAVVPNLPGFGELQRAADQY
ncbi:MAG: DegV family protein, partial [Solimonas sp.]